MVFAGIYPVDTSEFEELRSSMEVQLNDAALIWEPETTAALGLDSMRILECFIWRLFKNDWKENLV